MVLCIFVGEMGDVPPVKVGKDVCATIQSKAPQSTHKSGRNWSKVHAKLFQRCVTICPSKYMYVAVTFAYTYQRVP